ncbi:MAG: hypothetical protein JSV56_10415, partial [Methanomassiliicoccales archaeon]
VAVTGGPSYGNILDGVINVTDTTQFTLTGNDNSGIGVDFEWWYINDLGNYSEVNPFTLSSLSLDDGVYTLYYGSIDLLGNNETPNTLMVIVDDNLPGTDVAVTDGPSYGYIDNGEINVTDTTQFTLTGNDNSGVGVDFEWWYINDLGNYSEVNPFTLSSLSLDDGTYTLYYGSIDLLGNNETPKTLTVIVDNTRPNTDVAVTGGPSYGNINNGEINVTGTTQFTLTGTDDFGVGVDFEWWYINDLGNYSEVNPFTLAGLTLADGTYTMYYGSIDLLGNNETPKALIVIVDNTRPNTHVAVTGGPSYGNILDGVINVTDTTQFTLTGNDNSGIRVDFEWWYINDLGNYSEVNTFTLAGLSLDDGTYTLYYGSIDLLGNNGTPKTLTVIIDNTKPDTDVAVTGGPSYGNIDNGEINVTDTTQFTLTGTDNSGVGVDFEWWYINDLGNYSEINPFTLASLSLADGIYTLYYGSIDLLDNNETINTLTIFVDNSPPKTVISEDSLKYISDDIWISSDTTITLDAADDGSIPVGLDYTKYRIWDGMWSDWNAYFGGFTLDGEDGIRYVEFYSVDLLGNTEPVNNMTYILDNSPPGTTISEDNPKYKDDQNDVLNVTSATRLTLSAQDEGSSPVGLNLTFYRIWDNGSWSHWNIYTNGFGLGSESGLRYVEWYSVDYLGNEEPIHNSTYFVDNIPPTTDYILQLEPDNTEARISMISVDVGSGIYFIRYRIDSGDWMAYSGTFLINEPGLYRIYFFGVDKLGNVEMEKDLSVLIEAVDPSIPTDEDGEETNHKPLIAVIFTIILLLVGTYVSIKRPLRFVKENKV